MTWSADIVDQLEFYWHAHLRPRLDGLTDEEYWHEPVDGMWSVRPDGSGRLRPDGLVPDPPIPPMATIAWRLDHVTRGVLGIRARSLFGDPQPDADMFDESLWPEPIPAGAAGALASLDLAYGLWHTGLSALDDAGMSRPIGPRGVGYAEHSVGQLALHVNREVMAHGAEICLLRDFYRVRQQQRDPLVGAALRGDADAVRAANPGAARATLAAEAAGLHHWGVVRVLAEAGAPVDGALHYAAAAGAGDVAELLLEHGADRDAVDDRFSLTPAGWADFCGHTALAERLRRQGS